MYVGITTGIINSIIVHDHLLTKYGEAMFEFSQRV